MAANALRLGVQNMPIALLASPPGTGWTTVSTQQDPSSTSFVPASTANFAEVIAKVCEFEIIVGLKNADGTWSNAERQLVTNGQSGTWTVVRGNAALTHAVGESVYHELAQTTLDNWPGARTATGSMDYLASTGRLAELLAGADGTVLQVASGLPTWATPTGTGAPVLAGGSPTFTGTPVLGAATGTSVNVSGDVTSGNFVYGTLGGRFRQGNNSGMDLRGDAGIMYLGKDLLVGWTNGLAAGGTLDLYLSRAAAATLQLGIDINGAAVNQSLLGCNGIIGTDKTGANVTIGSGKGTGAGGISSVFIQTPTALASGTTAQTLTTRLTIDVNGIKATGYLSSDGSAGVSAGPYTTITSITCKNGLITAISGA